jgi:protein O-mannosyl-transferase
VAGVVFLAFLPVLGNGFVNWDDTTLLVDNVAYRGLGWPQIRWMFTTVLLGHFVPLTWLTLGLDYVLWGMNPVGYHLTNLLLHVAAAVLLAFVARRLLAAASDFSPSSLAIGSAVAALFFGIHPLRVETVAWVTERRGVLSGALFLASVLLYLEGTAAHGSRRRWCLSWSVAAYALAAVAKSSVMTLPLVLVLLDVYPLRRFRGGVREWLARPNWPIWAEKVPFLAAGLAAVLLGWLAHAQGSPEVSGSWVSRATNVLYSVTFYVVKTVLPTSLSPRYEAPLTLDPLEPRFLAAILGALALTLLALLARRRVPSGLVVWASYGVLLAPVSGIIPLASQLTADRYSYLPCLGWALLVGAGAATVAERATRGALGPTLVRLAAATMVLWLLTLGVLTWRQAGVWRDSGTLWRHAVEATPDCSLCHVSLAHWLHAQGDLEGAVSHYERALVLRPSRTPVHISLGWTLAKLGRRSEAAGHYRIALAADPTMMGVRTNLAGVLLADGRPSEAIDVLGRAAEVSPPDQVVAFLNEALAARPDDASLRLGLVQTYLAIGQVDLARAQYQTLRERQPSVALSVATLLPAVAGR